MPDTLICVNYIIVWVDAHMLYLMDDLFSRLQLTDVNTYFPINLNTHTSFVSPSKNIMKVCFLEIVIMSRAITIMEVGITYLVCFILFEVVKGVEVSL